MPLIVDTMSKGHSRTSLGPIQNLLHRGKTLNTLQFVCNARTLELPDKPDKTYRDSDLYT